MAISRISNHNRDNVHLSIVTTFLFGIIKTQFTG